MKLVQIRKITKIYEGFRNFVNLQYSQKSFDGKNEVVLERQLVINNRHSAFVTVYDPVHKLFLFVEQVRVCAMVNHIDKPTVIEPIAGGIEDGDSPLETAIKEALEEAKIKLDARNIELINSGYSVTAYSNEIGYHFLATADLSNYTPIVDGGVDYGESIQTKIYTADEALEMMRLGKINSAFSALGICYALYKHK